MKCLLIEHREKERRIDMPYKLPKATIKPSKKLAIHSVDPRNLLKPKSVSLRLQHFIISSDNGNARC